MGALSYDWCWFFHFNPKTEYNGTTVELRPLHTEGEGFPGSDVKE